MEIEKTQKNPDKYTLNRLIKTIIQNIYSHQNIKK